MTGMFNPFHPKPKSPFWYCLAASLLLTACGANAPASPTDAIAPAASSIPTLDSSPQMVCTSVSVADEEATQVDSPYPPVSDSDWIRGPEDADVTLVEYCDFQSPSCALFETSLTELEARYPEQVRLVYRYFPLIGAEGEPINAHAAIAVQAAEAAGAQGAFWEMHDLLFARQAEWSTLDDAALHAWLVDAAAELSLDTTQFATDLDSPELQDLATKAWNDGLGLGMTGTPYLVIDGAPYTGPSDIATLDTLVQLGLLKVRQFNECPAMTIDPAKQYIATFHTEKGDIIVQLYPDVAPMAVNSFVFLAEHDWFDNVPFHRVLPGFVAQSGDPTGTGYGGPGYTFGIETSPNLLFDRAGLLAMANSGPTSNGSQFFITYAPADQLNGSYTIFGEVISGMDVVENLTPRDPSQGGDLPPGDLILNVSIEVQ